MRRLRLVMLLVGIVALVGAPVAVWQVAGRYQEPFRGFTDDERFVEILPGWSSPAIGQALVAAGVVRDQMVFRLALWRTGAGRRLKAGEYRFDRPLTVEQVIARLAAGDVFLRRVTFREGLTIQEMSRVYESSGLGRADQFRTACLDVSLVADLDPEARDLEGYLFPDTFALPRRASATALVEQMVGRFREVFTEDLRRAAGARGLGIRQVVTLASIVEKETSRPDERPMVAAVFLRRLAIGMPLQSDPTVIYGLARAGRYDGNLTRKSLESDTPYNTYRRRGLPPGPIGSPGRGSVEAVIHPADVQYLYFVSRNDGSHAYSQTLAEHNRNVRRYQVEYFRSGKR